ncbi:MAG: sugar phosphate isomerase/epimerase family protein [Bryobacteraceae bacterium]
MLEPKIPLCAITDEFSHALATAIPVFQEIGITATELRVIGGKNILDMTDSEWAAAKEALDQAGLRVVSIASPVLKCVLPDAPPLDSRFEHDVFASKHTFEDQPRLIERALKAAKFFGADIVRVFSYWRTVEPERCFERVAKALESLARLGASEGVTIALENEHACNIATGAETARVLQAVPHPNLGVLWDPANALVAGERPFPDGYSRLPKNRIVHVHAKDCHMENDSPVWGPLGTRHVAWKEQIQALIGDGYAGFISLETHWRGAAGDQLESSRICGWNLRGLAAA